MRILSFLKRHIAFCLGGLALVARLPFLGPGYGNDADAWRIVRAARDLAELGQYSVSRVPGYPVVEVSYAVLARIGLPELTLATAIVSAASVLILYRLLLMTLCRNAAATTLAFAFVPIILIESTTTMDYIWSLSFVLSGFLALVSGRYWLAGILLGLAVGARLTAGAMIIPYLIALYGRRGSTDFAVAAIKICSAASLAAVFCYSIVVASYGFSFLTFFEVQRQTLAMAFGFSVGVWGAIGSVAVLVAAIVALTRFWLVGARNLERTELWDHLAFLSVVVVYTVAYIRLPAESAYLMPLVPFGLALLFHNLTVAQCRIALVVLVASPFAGFGSGYFQAPIFRYQERRHAEMEFVRSAWRAAASENGETVIVGGSWYSTKIALSKPETITAAVNVVSWIDQKRLNALGQRQAAVIVLEPAIRWHRKRLGIDLEKYPISVIRAPIDELK